MLAYVMLRAMKSNKTELACLGHYLLSNRSYANRMNATVFRCCTAVEPY